jgi:hypothetical protein
MPEGEARLRRAVHVKAGRAMVLFNGKSVDLHGIQPPVCQVKMLSASITRSTGV